jgi:uncharacterized protein (TIGR00251 family)
MAADGRLIMEIPYKKTKKGIEIEVRVEPRSSKKGVSGLLGNVVKVKLTAPPVDGAANEQLIEVISEATGLKKSAIRIIRGTSAKRKTLEIRGVDSL